MNYFQLQKTCGHRTPLQCSLDQKSPCSREQGGDHFFLDQKNPCARREEEDRFLDALNLIAANLGDLAKQVIDTAVGIVG